MHYPVDLALFEETSHTPSLFTLERSMGDDQRPLRDYCIPVNSYFPTKSMMDGWRDEIPRALKYYPADNRQISQMVAKHFDLQPDTVVMCNGATELLSWINHLFIHGTIVTPIPTFGRWTDVPLGTGKHVVSYVREADNNFQVDVADLCRFVRKNRAQAVVLCNPNNPTGACLQRREVEWMLDELPDLSLIVIDESFIDFCDYLPSPSVADLVAEYSNLVVMKSLGKNLGLHGLRMGYSVSNARVASTLRSHVPQWNINAVAELVLSSLPEFRSEYVASRRRVIADRRFLQQQLRRLAGVTVFPSQANFVYCRLPANVNGDLLRNRLLTEDGFLIRHCGNKIGASSQFLRLVARSAAETLELIAAMDRCLPSSSRSQASSRGGNHAPLESPAATFSHRDASLRSSTHV